MAFEGGRFGPRPWSTPWHSSAVRAPAREPRHPSSQGRGHVRAEGTVPQSPGPRRGPPFCAAVAGGTAPHSGGSSPGRAPGPHCPGRRLREDGRWTTACLLPLRHRHRRHRGRWRVAAPESGEHGRRLRAPRCVLPGPFAAAVSPRWLAHPPSAPSPPPASVRSAGRPVPASSDGATLFAHPSPRRCRLSRCPSGLPVPPECAQRQRQGDRVCKEDGRGCRQARCSARPSALRRARGGRLLTPPGANW